MTTKITILTLTVIISTYCFSQVSPQDLTREWQQDILESYKPKKIHSITTYYYNKTKKNNQDSLLQGISYYDTLGNLKMYKYNLFSGIERCDSITFDEKRDVVNFRRYLYIKISEGHIVCSNSITPAKIIKRKFKNHIPTKEIQIWKRFLKKRKRTIRYYYNSDGSVKKISTADRHEKYEYKYFYTFYK